MARAGESSSRLTPFMLKSRTGEFDLESIHFLDLSGMGLCDICCISECMSLLHLDVRNNNISSLDSLSALKLLETLNISNNNLSTLEGVQELSNLSSLNVAGNIIRSIDSLACLSKLEKLTTLRLQDAVENLSNPGGASRSIFSDIEFPRALGRSKALVTRMTTSVIIIIIHQTHYEKSDWSRAFNQFTIACELDMINVISAADITFIMSSSPQKQNG
ncbi:leucine-rich repeat-containing protein 61-like isoform X2 [Montipora foliosa]|uniref:leucine-rich repeat-containing protein 61-like isoform X2 n=1 Tax=Montipora foliosa TaxID=591990 RepID=UPI0035F19429